MSQAAVNSRDVEELKIARVYAHAAWNAADRQGAAKEFLEEFEEFATGVVAKQPELERFFKLDSVSQDQRQAFLEKVFKGRASDLLYSFLQTLNRHDRLSLVRSILVGLRELRDAAEKRVSVLVRSAVALTDKEKDSVAKSLGDKLKIKPRLVCEVDPDLLGGLWVKVGDVVLDRSVRSNLRQLRDNILTRSSHEIQSGRNSVDRSA